MSYWILPLLAAVANIVLAMTIWVSAARTHTARTFSFFSFVLALWNLNFFSLYFFDDYDTASLAAKWFRTGAAIVPAASLHLVVSIRDRVAKAWSTLVMASYAFAGLFVVANFTDLLVVALQPHPWGYYSVAGPAYSFYAVFVTVNLLLCLGILTFDYRFTPEPALRTQLRFWLLGASLVVPLGITNLLPAYNIHVYPMGNLGSAAFSAVVGYAIARHRLMDLDLVLSRGAAAAISAALVILPSMSALAVLHEYSYGALHPDVLLITTLVVIGASIAFPYLLSRIEPGLHASLFPEENRHRTSLLEFTRAVTRILDRDRLLHELATTLQVSLRTSRVCLVLRDPQGSSFAVAYALGDPVHTPPIPKSDPLIVTLEAHRTSMLRNEIPLHLDGATSMAALYASNDWELCVGLKVGERLLGFLALGPKDRTQTYSSQDLGLIEALANEAAIALENARLYAELKQSQAMIERADRSSALGVLAAGIAHEIRNPLVSIQTFFQLAPDRLHDEEFATTFLSTAANEVRRISSLIDELMSFARSPTASLGPVQLLDAVTGIETLLRPEAKRRRVTIAVAKSSQPTTVWGNEEQIRQVVLNLVLNALHATDPGGNIALTVRRAQVDEFRFGQIEIRDSGSGIPAEELERVFDPFFTTKAAGTGLGLAIVQRIVAEHQGRIAVRSEVGSGTTFTVDLPLHEWSPSGTR